MRCIILKTTYSLLLWCGTFSLMFVSSVASAAPIKPSERETANPSSNSALEQEKKLKFPDRGIPTGRRRGGTSRSECPVLDKPLTAIVPGHETTSLSASYRSNTSELVPELKTNKSQSFLTQTIEEYPSFWLYIPQAPGFASQGEFILQDARDRDIYRALFDLPSDSGILKIELPQQAQNSLEIGRKYHWYVKLFCNNNQTEYIFVDAWIRRVVLTPEIVRQLNSNTEQHQVYIDNDIMHDAIDRLAQMRKNNPHNIREQNSWNQLLSNLGLSDLMDKNILEIRANFPEE